VKQRKREEKDERGIESMGATLFSFFFTTTLTSTSSYFLRPLTPPSSLPLNHPTVFLVEEIVTLARSTREGGLSVLDFLLRNRLAANALSTASAGNAAARRKALKLVTAVCSRGPSDFKREAARSASGVIR